MLSRSMDAIEGDGVDACWTPEVITHDAATTVDPLRVESAAFCGMHAHSTTTHRASRGLRSRGLDEYVVLANCVSDAGVRSSQMTYFPESPNASPNVVAQTSYSQTSVWENAVTSGKFDDGNVFTATIGPPVGEGEFAWTGKASQGVFSCWGKYRKNLYKWAEHLCTGVYDCNRKCTGIHHQGAFTRTLTRASTAPPSQSAPTTTTSTTSPITTKLVETIRPATQTTPPSSYRLESEVAVDTRQQSSTVASKGSTNPQRARRVRFHPHHPIFHQSLTQMFQRPHL